MAQKAEKLRTAADQMANASALDSLRRTASTYDNRLQPMPGRLRLSYTSLATPAHHARVLIQIKVTNSAAEQGL